MTNGDARSELDREMDEILARNREAFLGKYKDEINELSGLSRDDIDAITPGTTDLETYNALIEVVKEASRKNYSQAQLKARIEQLGSIAVQIAKRASGLRSLFG